MGTSTFASVLAALAGGVGAARFLRGLVQVVPPEDITVVVNTGDDDWFHGLLVCPDLDTVTYTLAGTENPDTGWGLAGETFAAIDKLERYGSPTWFRLGDQDLGPRVLAVVVGVDPVLEQRPAVAGADLAPHGQRGHELADGHRGSGPGGRRLPERAAGGHQGHNRQGKELSHEW